LFESIGIIDVISAIVTGIKRIHDSFGTSKIRRIKKVGSPKIRRTKLR